MRIRLIGSSFGGDPRAQYATTLLVNDAIAVDCGGLGFWKTPDDQAAIRDVVITHTHADHLATLPIFVENAYLPGRPPVRVWGSDAVLTCIREDVLNDRVYPDFSLLPTPEAPFVTLMSLSEGTPIEIAGVRITPVAVDHTVPTLGMVLESGSSSVVIVSDTGPTERIWEVANRVPNLKAVYLAGPEMKPAAEIDDAVNAYVSMVVRGGPIALAASKDLIRRVPNLNRSDGFAWTSLRSRELFQSEEATEGIAAFNERRDPNWVPD